MTEQLCATQTVMKPEEVLYTYRNSQQISSQTGLIGYVRADMGSSGYQFWSVWNGFRNDLNTPHFSNELTQVIHSLRTEGRFLASRNALSAFCHDIDNALPFESGKEYGVRINTDAYAYLMRLNPHKGEYNLYCYCYRKDWLDSHIERAKRGIRFIDSQYRNLFRLADGDEIIIKGQPDGFTVNEVPARYVCRYVDDYHFEYGPNMRHICEFAEIMEDLKYTVVPLRASLPEKSFVFLEAENKVGMVVKGEMGYIDMGLTFSNNQDAIDTVNTNNKMLGVSKAQAQAMFCGSMFGWQCLAADPKNYDDDGVLLRPQFKVRDTAR
jgi:hypothetical protein